MRKHRHSNEVKQICRVYVDERIDDISQEVKDAIVSEMARLIEIEMQKEIDKILYGDPSKEKPVGILSRL